MNPAGWREKCDRLDGYSVDRLVSTQRAGMGAWGIAVFSDDDALDHLLTD